MAATIYYIPAESQAGAENLVSKIEAGVVPRLPEYLDATKAADSFDRYPRGSTYRLWAIERRAVDDGRITNVWVFDKIGDIAATLALIGYGLVVGLASCWENFA